MNTEEAKQLLTSFRDALSQILHDNNVKEQNISRLEPLAKDYMKFRRENLDLKDEVYDLTLVAKYSPVEICKECRGKGGYEYEVPGGGISGSDCMACNGNGVVKKKVASETLDGIK